MKTYHYLILSFLMTSLVACTTQRKGKELVASTSQDAKFDTELKSRYAPINFQFDSAMLTSKQKKNLKKIADKIVSQKQDKNIFIMGHTDATGARSYNIKLGLQRAITVKKLLIEYGVNPESIKISSLGEKKPIVSDSTHEMNRRVIIKTNDRTTTYSINIPRFQ